VGVTSAREGEKREKTVFSQDDSGEGKKREKMVNMSPNRLMKKGYGRIEEFYEPELLDEEGLRSHRQVL
jgi:hypothetical protein